MKSTEVKVYEFDELSDEAKQKALENYRDINLDYYWYQVTSWQASDAGIKIENFDIDKQEISGSLTEDAYSVATILEDSFSEGTEVYKDAAKFMNDWNNLVTKYSDGVNTDKVAEGKEEEFDQEADELEKEFTNTILQDYLIILREEYEYRSSNEAVIDSIRANEYQFTEDGETKIYTNTLNTEEE